MKKKYKNKPNQTRNGYTCAHMGACKIGSAEAHNFREKDLDYIRKELSINNFYSPFRISAVERDRKSREAYREATNQKDQDNYAPIQEIIVVGISQKQEAEDFVNEIEKRFKMEPLSWAVHNDEGHFDVFTGKWIPNHHAHFVVDTTCWTHEPQKTIVRIHGHAQKDANGNTITEMKDLYGHRYIFTSSDMSDLQDIAAKVTGLKRGDMSDKKHLEMIQLKIQEATKDYERLQAEIKQMEREIDRKNEEMRDQLKKSRTNIKKYVTDLDSEFAKIHQEMKLQLGQDYYMTRDEVIKKTTDNNDDDYREAHTTSEDLFSSFILFSSIIIETTRRFAEELIKRRNKELREIKELSLLKSLKKFLVTLLQKPATEQAKELKQRVNSVEEENAKLRAAKEAAEKKAEKYETGHMLKEEWDVKCRELEETKREMYLQRSERDKQVFSFTKQLIANCNSSDLERLDQLGIRTVLSPTQWDRVKKTVQHRAQSGPAKKISM